MSIAGGWDSGEDCHLTSGQSCSTLYVDMIASPLTVDAVPDLGTLGGALRYLAPRAYLSGSWARGRQTENSDLDFYLCDRKVGRLARELTAQGLEWDSCIPGSLTWWPGMDLGRTVLYPQGETTMQVEVSSIFRRYRCGRVVEVFGVDLRT